ncbi:YbaB/EbfC family nucleoid-associated protein [Actinomadura sp. DC4]|uniref:YbaB/EbfC family nucleoid-associated protein n=1 Tax=Actinomadura sp. DC4 TaxID=3055069 RepID=UPI0025B1C4DF|nr:YbaB/EbfC family nucleoid-associated protein [Actinomadura sp. DC4]MDN3354413.1 YbaB/EbfC family nucleoid-associated protein [Actinomadura sp. DC4]
MADFRKRSAGKDEAPASAWPGGPAALEKPPTGHGASADDNVRVTIGTDGLVDTVEINPRALRQDARTLGELTREAVRAAQRDWFGRLADHDPGPASEDRLRARLEEIQAEYSQRMEEINRVIAGLMRSR